MLQNLWLSQLEFPPGFSSQRLALDYSAPSKYAVINMMDIYGIADIQYPFSIDLLLDS
jgi:hypothetical protein